MKLVKGCLANPTPIRLLENQDTLPIFELRRGSLLNGERSLDYVVQDVRGLCYTVNFTVFATKQQWAVFVPTDEMIVEMLRVWGKKKYVVRMRKFSAWLVASIKIEFHPNTNIIKSAVLQKEIFQNLLLNELSNMVHAASVHIQTAMRRFKANKEANIQAIKDEKIRRSRMIAMERVKAREQQASQSSASQRRQSTKIRLTNVNASADDLPLLKSRQRYYSSGYVTRMHKSGDSPEASFKPPPIFIPMRPDTTHDTHRDHGASSHHAPQTEEERRIALEEEMTHLRHELEAQRNQFYYARGPNINHSHGSVDSGEAHEEGVEGGIALSPRKASLLNSKVIAAKEMKQLKTEIDLLQKHLFDVSEALLVQRREAMQAFGKAEEEIVHSRQQAEKVAVETAEQLKQEAIEVMKTQLQTKEQHTTRLLQRQRVLEQQREEQLRKDMEEKYKELERKLQADTQAALDRQDLLRNQLADLKKQQQKIEAKRKTQIRRESNSILDDDQSLATMLPSAIKGCDAKTGEQVGGKVMAPRQVKKPAPSANNIDLSKRVVNMMFDESEEEEVYEEEDQEAHAQREKQRQLQIVQQLNRAVEKPNQLIDTNKKRGWISWLFAKKGEVISPPPAPSSPLLVMQPAPSATSLASQGISGASGSLCASVADTSYAKSVFEEASGVYRDHAMVSRGPLNKICRKIVRKKPNPEKEKLHAMAKIIQQLARHRISRKQMALNKEAKQLRKKALFEILPHTTECAMFNSALQTSVELDNAKLMRLTIDRLLQLFDEYDYKDEALPMHLSEVIKALLAFTSHSHMLDKGLELLHKVFKMKPVLMSKHDISESMCMLLLETFCTHLEEDVLLLRAMRLLSRLAKRSPDTYSSFNMLEAVRRVLEKVFNTDLDIMDGLLRYIVIVAKGSRPRQERLGQAQIVECVFMSLLHNYTKAAPLVVMHCRAIQNFCAENCQQNQAILGKGMYPNLLVQSVVAFKNDPVMLPEIISAMVSVYANNPKNKPKFLGAAGAEVFIDLCAVYAADDKVAGLCLWALSHLACSTYKPKTITKIMKALKQYATGDYSAVVQDEAHKGIQRFMMGLNARPNTPVPLAEPIFEPKAAEDSVDNEATVQMTEEQREENNLDAELNAIHAMQVDDDGEYRDEGGGANEDGAEDGDLFGSARLTSSFKNAYKSNKIVANAHMIAMTNSYMYTDGSGIQ
ncbi:hypothetical protein EON65_02725 [archaeon]|nr:MAG: hypothetical protein EON65_02725 [archaeon]